MWQSETKFVDDFVETVGYTDKPLHIEREFRTGYGLPDILSIEYDRVTVARRRRNVSPFDLRPFDTNCAYAMVHLSQRRWMKLSSLKSSFASYNGSFKTIMENLLDRGLIIRRDDKVRSLPIKEIFAIKSIVAIEAKLENWKRAIFQAQRYLWFTNNSNILIPEPSNRLLNRIKEHCERHEVGLISFGESKKVSPLIRMKRTKPYNTYLAWLLNELLLEKTKDGPDTIQS